MRLIDADELIQKLLKTGYLKMDSLRDSVEMIAVQALIDDAPTVEPLPNSPLTLEELREMDGEPVYCYFGPEHGEWGLVLARQEGVFLRLKNGIDGPARFVHECGGNIYRRRPEEGVA